MISSVRSAQDQGCGGRSPAGHPLRHERIVAIARRHGIKVVEDCAQALDCRIDGQHVGTFEILAASASMRPRR
ncbi:MAG: DegT/DnrJ/EryC1/StrS family aminotransferase [Ruthenibacterium lactatiformans]